MSSLHTRSKQKFRSGTDNDSPFIYIHNIGSTSSLTLCFVLLCLLLLNHSMSIFFFGASDHFSILNSFTIDSSKSQNSGKSCKWSVNKEWSKTYKVLCATVLDKTLSKIKVPFQLLQRTSSQPKEEKQILLNVYCREITHALRCLFTMIQ